MRWGRLFFLAILLLCLIETARLWGAAPEQMAAHFNVQGSPDRFVPRAEFFRFQYQTLLTVVLVSLPFQFLFQFLSPDRINMPHREYWLAPGRRAGTLERLNSFGAVLFGVILVGLQAGFEFSFRANLQTPIVFNAPLMLAVMAACLVAVLLMLAWLVLSFRLPEGAQP